MLGYVRVNMPELRMRDYECYRALYCGLCRHMGKCTGQCSRLSLSYDFVFLAAVRIALLGEEMTFKKKRCLVHPFTKRSTVVDSPTLRYCADASALLSYHKLRDDISDEKGMKRLRARLACIFFGRAYRRARRRHPALDRSIAEHLGKLSAYEADTSSPPSADMPASIFASLMEDVFREGLEDANARISAAIGRAIGHWVYLVDAADDFARDKENGSFNPYLRLFGEEFTKEQRENVRLSLVRILMDAERAFVLIDSFPNSEIKEILCNALYLGLPQAAEKILTETAKGESDQNENPI